MQIPEEVKKEFEAIAAAQAEKAVASRMSATQPPAPGATDSTASIVATEPKMTIQRRLGAAVIKAYLAAKDPHLGEAEHKSLLHLVEKSNVLAGTAGKGGSLLPPQYSSEVIGVLRERSVMLASGARLVNYPGPSFTFGKLNQGVTIGWTTETGTPTPADIASVDLKLQDKYLKGYVTVSNAAMRATGPDVAEVLGSDLINALAEEIDKQFFVGTGAANAPTGITGQLDAGQIVAITATPTVLKVRKDLANAMSRVRVAKIHFDGMSPCWVMPSGTYFQLLAMRDGAGNAFPALEQSNTLYGYPVCVSESVGDRTIFCLMGHVLWGASFGPATGVGLMNADLAAGTSTIFAHFAGDVKIRYDKAAAVVTGTNGWSATT
jgi:HK97 family phage major capsid protein